MAGGCGPLGGRLGFLQGVASKGVGQPSEGCGPVVRPAIRWAWVRCLLILADTDDVLTGCDKAGAVCTCCCVICPSCMSKGTSACACPQVDLGTKSTSVCTCPQVDPMDQTDQTRHKPGYYSAVEWLKKAGGRQAALLGGWLWPLLAACQSLLPRLLLFHSSLCRVLSWLLFSVHSGAVASRGALHVPAMCVCVCVCVCAHVCFRAVVRYCGN